MSFLIKRSLLLLIMIIMNQLLKSSSAQENDECSLLSTCASCIAADCVWCLDNIEQVNKSDRCQMRKFANCKNLFDPPAITETIILNKDISEVIQVAPQRVALELRPNTGQNAKVEFSVQQSASLPLDLYFLLDLSWSMQGVRDNFALQAEAIVQQLRLVTPKLRVGFGSFVDKNIQPFANCGKNDKNENFVHKICPRPFANLVSLTSSIGSDFRQRVMEAPLAENIDEPESSLDALMQVMLCDDTIGWRHSARRVILLATDRDFHFAMDGRLLGLLEPHDGNCGLDSSNVYVTTQDYPSVSQVISEAQSRSFVLIFAVIPQYLSVWSSLANLMPGLGHVAVLERDAANIVELITERYKEITSSITLNVEKRGNYNEAISVKVNSFCRDFYASNLTCPSVELGTKVDFWADVRLNRCLDNENNDDNENNEDNVKEENYSYFVVNAVGLNASIRVDISPICDCSKKCDLDNKYDVECSNQGHNVCGVCKCDQLYFGPACECKLSDSLATTNNDNNENCRRNNEICSNRGQCVCGQCQCEDFPRIYGQFCECDDLSCARDKFNRLCSNNGQCKCGKCVCNELFSGENCECSEDSQNCKSPFANDAICSDQGRCVCNKCECNESSEGALYSGQYCHLDPSEVAACQVVKRCVECLAKFEECQCEFLQYEEIENSQVAKFANFTKCQLTNVRGCNYLFLHNLPDERRAYLVLNEDGSKDVCYGMSALFVSGGVFGSILLAGLVLLLVYKCLIVIDDRQLYAKHVRETDRVWHAVNHTPNEMYRSPISRYENPMFKGNK